MTKREQRIERAAERAEALGCSIVRLSAGGLYVIDPDGRMSWGGTGTLPDVERTLAEKERWAREADAAA